MFVFRRLLMLCSCVVILVALGGLAGCQKERGVIEVTQKTTVASPDSSGANGDMSTMERMGFRAKPQEAAVPQYGIQFKAPESWKPVEETPLRKANFVVGPNGEAECYFSLLPGEAGGIAANVNRWRKQIGLEPASEEELGALPTIPMMGGQAAYVDLEGTYTGMGEGEKPDYQMLAALMERPAGMVFVKMVGPAAIVSAERDNFKAFCASLTESGGVADAGGLPADHPPIGALPPDHPPVAGMPDMHMTPASNLEWAVPEGWSVAPQKPMRSVTLKPEGSDTTECYISELAGDGGGLAANINRWRSQMGQSALGAEEIDGLPKLTVLGQSAPMVEIAGEYQGMTGDAQPGYTMYAVAVLLPERSVFIKMIGPESEMTAQKDNFIRFCESLSVKGTPA